MGKLITPEPQDLQSSDSPHTDGEEIIIEFLKRLYDPNGRKYRRTGRTTIMAKAFMRIAKENPGEKIQFHDHYPGKEGTRSMEDTLRRLLRMLGDHRYQLGMDFIIYHEHSSLKP